MNSVYDVVVLVSDATASGSKEHYYKTTLKRIKDYYGAVTYFERFENAYAAASSRTRTMNRYTKRELTTSFGSLICLILGARVA